ncbi:MAG: hypothetical protein WA431_10175 [Candidatus Cybelea sp.]
MERKKLEQRWVTFQLEIVALRGPLGTMCDIAFNGRREHTFFPGNEPKAKVVEAVMGATPSEPNGIPDAFAVTSGGTYAARTLSVMAASIIILWLDAAIEKLARDLGQPVGASMLAGDDVAGPASPPVKMSSFIWAAANSIRHIDEWHGSKDRFQEPSNASEKALRDKQNASHEPLAGVLGHNAPITENVAFEVLQCLVATSESKGNYLHLESRVLRIGQDLVQRNGRGPAPIGVTVKGYHDLANAGSVAPEDIVMTDGTMRAAASLPDVAWLDQVGPRPKP